MKHQTLFALFLALLVTACSGSSPEDQAVEFATAMETQDWDAARDLMDPAQRGLLDMAIGMAEGEEAAAPGDVKIEVVECKIEDGVATVQLKNSSTGKTDDLTLRKIDGEWLVYVDKTR